MTANPAIDMRQLTAFVAGQWAQEILPCLMEYIRIPAKSPIFDPDWQAHGYIDQAARMMCAWAESQLDSLQSARVELLSLPGRTPLLFIDIPGASEEVVLLYGHFDKQPEMEGWNPGLSAWKPVVQDGKLYGRGGADDGYAMFSAVTALKALAEQSVPHARCVLLIEGCEESGSYDLPAYIEHLADKIGEPSLVICLDSWCGNYDQLWVTTSLRGATHGTLRVDILEEGVHSGAASGIVPSSFRIVRQLLSRVEEEETGSVLPREFHATIPPYRVAEARFAADCLGSSVYTQLPLTAGASPISKDPFELILNRNWRAQLAVTGAEGLPPLESAGNVVRPFTTVQLSLRLPPTIDAERATMTLKALLERDPPYDARVEFTSKAFGNGWDAPAFAPWLKAALDRASIETFGREAAAVGEGGTIPFMNMLGARFPAAQFMVTGVLGPRSNAHGPNEFLHIDTAKHVTSCIAYVLAAHFEWIINPIDSGG